MQKHTRNRSNSTFKRVALEPIYRTQPFLLFLALSLSLFYGHAIVIDRLPRKCLLTVRPGEDFLGEIRVDPLKVCKRTYSVDSSISTLKKLPVLPRDNCKALILIKIHRKKSKLIAFFLRI